MTAIRRLKPIELFGISAVLTLPYPLWFTLADLILAYIPMAYIAGRLATARK